MSAWIQYHWKGKQEAQQRCVFFRRLCVCQKMAQKWNYWKLQEKHRRPKVGGLSLLAQKRQLHTKREVFKTDSCVYRGKFSRIFFEKIWNFRILVGFWAPNFQQVRQICILCVQRNILSEKILKDSKNLYCFSDFLRKIFDLCPEHFYTIPKKFKTLAMRAILSKLQLQTLHTLVKMAGNSNDSWRSQNWLTRGEKTSHNELKIFLW